MRQEKDLTASVTRREAGNTAFQGGDYHTAMVNYSRAVVMAVDDTPDLGMAYANRWMIDNKLMINLVILVVNNVL